jgi:acetylornithine deacetylase/succinyl-diaminopimelate desuccinylase-like protein
VVGICRDLIRFDTSNYGTGEGPGERAAAEYVMELLTEVGLAPEIFESEPGRASVGVRL